MSVIGLVIRPAPKGDPAPQLAALERFAQAEPHEFLALHADAVFAIARAPATTEVQMRAAALLSKVYPALAPDAPEFARRVHEVLLRELREPRKTLAHPSCNWLLMTHLRDENLQHIPWQSAEEVATAAECFYGFCDGTVASDEAHRRVRDLVKHAGDHFAHASRWEEAFKLLATVPVPTTVMDADLFRLRSTLALYEQRRVQRFRRGLQLFMALSFAFMAVLSPLLFMLAENPARIARGQPAVGVFDAVYWSVITAATVGYGEIVPVTPWGKGLAIAESLIGITATGLIAGLILGRVTPRALG